MSVQTNKCYKHLGGKMILRHLDEFKLEQEPKMTTFTSDNPRAGQVI
jgi:hypothetical protein